MRRTAVVTGAATGIGREIAARFVDDGMTVVITGRRAELLERTAAELGPNVRAVPFELARSHHSWPGARA
jgi:3-oxoacyl-[acyl-carrier protein] reductase